MYSNCFWFVGLSLGHGKMARCGSVSICAWLPVPRQTAGVIACIGNPTAGNWRQADPRGSPNT